MTNTLITIASYEDRRLADHHAELLRNRGLTCHVNEAQIAEILSGMDDEDGAYQLQVSEAEAYEAFEWLDALEQTPLYEPGGEGDILLLIGGVLAMIGILISFGRFEDLNSDFLLLPYVVVLIGGCLFLRGLMANRQADDAQA
jgi:hypothetical protein